MAKEDKKSVFDTLNAIDCSEHVENKEGLTYLSWSWAWQIVKKHYPDANYMVREWEGKPYLFDESLGYYVETAVTIQGESIRMHLPVMDAKKKAQKNMPYTYIVRGRDAKSYEKTVEAATMFDINTAIMRCLVKNLAMFGLGLYIYAGEDIPEEVKEDRMADASRRAQEAASQRVKKAVEDVHRCENTDQLTGLWNTAYKDLQKNPEFAKAVREYGTTLRAKEANNGAA